MPYIGNPPRVANFLVDTFSGDNSETSFTMQIPVASPAAVLVFLDGVRQATESYTVTDRTITFDAAPFTGNNNVEIFFPTPLILSCLIYPHIISTVWVFLWVSIGIDYIYPLH